MTTNRHLVLEQYLRASGPPSAVLVVADDVDGEWSHFVEVAGERLDADIEARHRRIEEDGDAD